MSNEWPDLIPASELASIAEVPAHLVNKIDEDVFVRKWLPMFAGVWKDADGNVPIGTWINQVAKGHQLPVDVVSRGKVIYRIPPILGRTIVSNAVKRPDMPYFEAHNRYQAMEARMPGSGKKYLEMYTKQFKPEDTAVDEDMNMFWLALFDKYKVFEPGGIAYTPDLEQKVTKDASVEDGSSDDSEVGGFGDDDFEFED